jgi:hypothetical protein
MVVLACDETYYLATTSQLEHTLGAWNKPWKASGPEPEARLNQPPGLWHNAKSQATTAVLSKLDSYKVQSPELLYKEITRRCSPLGEIRPTLTAGELRAILPRPAAPEAGSPLGSALN